MSSAHICSFSILALVEIDRAEAVRKIVHFNLCICQTSRSQDHHLQQGYFAVCETFKNTDLPAMQPGRLKSRTHSPRRVQTELRMGVDSSSSRHGSLDQDKVDMFGADMLILLNNGALTIMISIGHKLRLFEVMASLPSVTSLELSQATGLHERYLREWMSTMYAGGILEIEQKSGSDPEQRFFLPPEHAAFLTWGRGPENVAVLSQYISILSSFEARTVECFKTGGGVEPTEFGELKSIMAADSAQTIASSLIGWILPMGDGMVVTDLKEGITVLDVGCGSGLNLITLAKEYPRSWFTGYDANPALIAMASGAVEREKLRNIRFRCVSITESMESSAYDLITCFGGLAETGDMRNVVERIYHSLRRGGTFLLQDVASSSDTRENRSHPAGPLLYAISVMYSLPATIAKTGGVEEAVGVMWGNDKALGIVRDAGFKCEGVKTLPEDHCNVFLFCTRD